MLRRRNDNMREKSKVSYVVLKRAEGPTNECGSVLFYVGDSPPEGYAEMPWKASGGSEDLKEAVDKQMVAWGRSAPEPEKGGYDKCDFKVAWENGESYDGRFDLQMGGTADGKRFWESLKGRLEYYSCRVKPAHAADPKWERAWERHCLMFKTEGWDLEAGGILDGCEV